MDELSAAGLTGLALVVVSGAGTQRVTGLGFALVSSPFLVLLLGPFQGVLLANALSLAANLVVLAQTWRAVEVRRALLLAVPALAAVVPGAWVAGALPAPVLSVLVGSLVLVALLVVLLVQRARVLRGHGGAVAAGGASGFMNVTAGVGGPAITLYAISTEWQHRPFVATVQLYFALLNAGSLLVKGWPQLAPSAWGVAALALAMGILVGHRLSGVVSPERARAAVVVLALLGAGLTVGKGLLQL